MRGYKVTVEALDANTRERLGELAAFEYIEADLPEELQRVRSPTGAARSTISDLSGVATFPMLMLMDAVDGTCFVMSFSFSPASTYERATIEALDATFQEPINVTSGVTFCAVNGRTYSAAGNPSSEVAPGVVVATPPHVTLEQPLEPIQYSVGGPVRYYLPFGIPLGTHLMQLQPTTIGSEVLPLWKRPLVGGTAVGGNVCLIRGSTERYARCTASSPPSGLVDVRYGDVGKVMNGIAIVPVNASSHAWPSGLGNLYSPSFLGDAPTFAVNWALPRLVVRSLPGLETMVLGATGNIIEEPSDAATFQVPARVMALGGT